MVFKQLMTRLRGAYPSSEILHLTSGDESMVRRFLNVGGGNKAIAVPPYYADWEHVLLDIDPRGGPDIVCDARALLELPPKQFDAIYCSHNLEHYYRHDVQRVLAGFVHLIKDDGFIDIRVPDIMGVAARLIKDGLDIDDVLYTCDIGSISAHDVIYGYGEEIERSGQNFYAHKCGFSEASLRRILQQSGFTYVYAGAASLEVRALAFLDRPSDFSRTLLNLPS